MGIRRRREDNIKTNLPEIIREVVGWIENFENYIQW
jgi:hypothetical protein